MPQDSPLIKLPAELRNDIYRMLLVQEVDISTNCRILATLPALLATSRQIRDEAQSIYYGENTFSVNLPLTARDKSALGWYCARKPTSCNLIEHVIVHYDISRYSPHCSSTFEPANVPIVQWAVVEGAKRQIRALVEAGVPIKAIKFASIAEDSTRWSKMRLWFRESGECEVTGEAVQT